MKLELKHLVGYLPYELKGIMYYGGCVRENVELGLMDIPVWLNGSYPIKPILRPLSDLTKEIEVNGEKFVPMKKILKEVGLNYPQECYNQDEAWVLNDGYRALGEFSYRKIQLLFEWHFDVFGLIEQGLAIDINTLEK